AAKLASSGSMNDASGGAAVARRVSDSHERSLRSLTLPARPEDSCFQMRRHSCTSHKPVMFFSTRIVLPTPPSLVNDNSRHNRVGKSSFASSSVAQVRRTGLKNCVVVALVTSLDFTPLNSQ